MDYYCKICNKYYSSYQSLWKHNKIYHKNEISNNPQNPQLEEKTSSKNTQLSSNIIEISSSNNNQIICCHCNKYPSHSCCHRNPFFSLQLLCEFKNMRNFFPPSAFIYMYSILYISTFIIEGCKK